MSINNRTVRFSPHSGPRIARGAHRNALARRFGKTLAYTPAVLCMGEAMCDMGVLRPTILAQCVMHRTESCVDVARYIDGNAPRNDACELKSWPTRQGSAQLLPASALPAQETLSNDVQLLSDVPRFESARQVSISGC